MRLSLFFLLVSLVPVLRARLENSRAEIDVNVIKIYGMLHINLQEFDHLSEDHVSKKLLSHMFDARESLADSWMTGGVDPEVNFEGLHPDLTAHAEGRLRRLSPLNLYTARQERMATIRAMRQVFISEKEFAQSVRYKEEALLKEKIKEWCEHLVEASRHQIKARKAGNGKVNLRRIAQYREAFATNYGEQQRLRDS